MGDTQKYVEVVIIVDDGENTRTYEFPRAKNGKLSMVDINTSLYAPDTKRVTFEFDAEFDQASGYLANETNNRHI